MPNGHHGTLEQWQALEAPLIEMDGRLREFAGSHGLEFSCNYHNWPERSLTWFDGDVRKLIQIFLESDVDRTFTFWACASREGVGRRAWKQKNLVKASPPEDIAARLDALLGQAKSLLDSWTQADLVPAPQA